MFSLTGKVAVITGGGSSGIGKSRVERFTRAGAQVVMAGRSLVLGGPRECSVGQAADHST